MLIDAIIKYSMAFLIVYVNKITLEVIQYKRNSFNSFFNYPAPFAEKEKEFLPRLLFQKKLDIFKINNLIIFLKSAK